MRQGAPEGRQNGLDTYDHGSLAICLDGERAVLRFRKVNDSWWKNLNHKAVKDRHHSLAGLQSRFTVMQIKETSMIYDRGPGRPPLSDTIPHFPKPVEGKTLPDREFVTLVDVARYYKLAPLTVRRRFAAWGIPVDDRSITGRVLIDRDVAEHPLKYVGTVAPYEV